MPTLPSNESTTIPCIWIRADGGLRIGYGHWIRAIRMDWRLSRWARVQFVVQNAEQRDLFLTSLGEKRKVIIQQQAEAMLGLEPPDCLITDLSQVDAATLNFIHACQKSGVVVASIHDLGLGIYDSDLAIDPSIVTIHPFQPDRYRFGFYGGPQYAVLADSFAQLRGPRRGYSGYARSLLVTLGGGSSWDILENLLPALERLSKIFRVVILTGLAPENQDRLNQSIPPSLECIYLASQDDPAELLLEADLAMVAGGITLYEAACLGTPALVVSHNELQQVTASRFDALGISRNLGLASALSSSQMEEAVLKLAGDVGLRAKMGAYGRELVDGRGAERIEELIRRLCVSMEKSTGNEKSHAQL